MHIVDCWHYRQKFFIEWRNILLHWEVWLSNRTPKVEIEAETVEWQYESHFPFFSPGVGTICLNILPYVGTTPFASDALKKGLMEGDNPLLLLEMSGSDAIFASFYTQDKRLWEDKKLASGSKWQDLHLNEVKGPKPIVFAHTYTASHNNNTLSYILQSTLQKNSRTMSCHHKSTVR